eukprot:682819-Prorocentrum_minimum.AAC.1
MDVEIESHNSHLRSPLHSPDGRLQAIPAIPRIAPRHNKNFAEEQAATVARCRQARRHFTLKRNFGCGSVLCDRCEWGGRQSYASRIANMVVAH